MKIFYTMLIVLAVNVSIIAQNSIKGRVLEQTSKQPIIGAILYVADQNKSVASDANGYFELKGLKNGTSIIKISMLSFRSKLDTVALANNQVLLKNFYLEESVVNFSDVVVTSRKGQDASNMNALNSLSAIDFKLRPHLTTQDLLRLVPGLFIAQHAGGGKAEQLFLRGFDADHGTDIAISVDNLPVNMVSHAHGQGYADLHFVIPETVDKLNFSKGPYDAKNGDFNTAGSVRFQTKSYLPKNLLKVEYGRFNTFRSVAMVNLLNNADTSYHKHNAYVAGEYFYSTSFFTNPQDFSKVNLFGKYTSEINSSTNIALTLSAFSSKWNAAGEIPLRAVQQGLISPFGSLDPSQGGYTSRYNANLTLNKKFENGDRFQSNMYYVNYNYNLYSNFTYYMSDSVNGDEIYQHENRNLFGYNASYVKENQLSFADLKSTVGIGLRDDQIGNIGMEHVKNRQFLNDIQKGEIHETNVNAYIDENIYFSPRFSMNLGLRYDQFHFTYRNKMSDTINGVSSKDQGIASPKASIYYNPTKNLQIYVSAGSGFHSNDARVATQAAGTTLPKATGADLGTNFKLGSRLFVNAAIWILDLESEYTWDGDVGMFDVNPNGKTRRIGVDFSARGQILDWLFADFDLNLAKPRFISAPEGENYVPGAPTITNIAGLNVRTKNGITASLRYRYLGARPLTSDNSLVAQSYFIMDAVFGYTHDNFTIGFIAENLLNSYWREAQFSTVSQLKGEKAPVDDITYLPGTPFNLRVNATISF